MDLERLNHTPSFAAECAVYTDAVACWWLQPRSGGM